MKSALCFAVVATSAALAHPAARAAATFAGFPELGCVTAAVAEAAAVDAIAGQAPVLQIGKVIQCSGFLGKQYRADIKSCNVRILFSYDSKTEKYGFCSSVNGIPAPKFIGFPESLSCNAEAVTKAALTTSAADLLAVRPRVPAASGGHTITCNGVSGAQFLIKYDSCARNVYFNYHADSDSYGFCQSFAGEPSFVGFPAQIDCGPHPVLLETLKADVYESLLSDPNLNGSGCSNVSGGSYAAFYDQCQLGFRASHNPATNTFGFCSIFEGYLGKIEF